MNGNNSQHDNRTELDIRTHEVNFNEEIRRKIRQQIQRTNIESQKVENIINSFVGRTSEEHDVYAPDKTPGAPMEAREDLTFTFSPDNIKAYIGGTPEQGVRFLVKAVEDYTGFERVEAYRTENKHGNEVITVEFETTNYT